MFHGKLVIALTSVTLAMAHAEGRQAQTELPPGARVRLGTLDFLAG